MANRRMLSVSISVSEQVADLRDDFARLLFTWMIPHADDYGVLPGSARKIRGLVIPQLDHTTAEVEEALNDMDAHDLIWRYSDKNGVPWLQFRSFEIHQTGLHKRTQPKQPRYCDVVCFPEVPGSSGNGWEIPSELKRREENLREEKRREEEGANHANGVAEVVGADAPGVVVVESPAPVPSSVSVKLTERALSKLCGEIAHAAGAQLDAKALRGLIEQHPALDPKRLLFEVGLAAEWIADPVRNKAGKRRMNIRFLHNWLNKAEQPPAHLAAMPARARSRSAQANVEEDEPHLPVSNYAPPEPEPLPPVSLAGYQETPKLWGTIAADLRNALPSVALFDTTFGAARLMMPQRAAPSGSDEEMMTVPTLVLHSRFALEQSDRYVKQLVNAFERVAPQITRLRRVCRAQVTAATASEPVPVQAVAQ